MTPAVGHRPRMIRSVRIHGGQGDVLMAINGLQALIELGVPCLADNAGIYTRTDTAPLIQAILPTIRVVSLQESRGVPHPRYVIVQRTSWSTVLRNWFYTDYYVNFPERRLVTSYGYPPPGVVQRLKMMLTDLRYGTSINRARETPTYYGLKIWAPLAGRWGISDTALMRGLYAAHRTLRQRLLAHAQALGPPPQEAPVPSIAIFPAGRGFQYVPPAFVVRLITEAKLRSEQYACCFGPNDASIDDYRSAGLPCRITHDPMALLRIVAGARVTVTSDSFVSHLAQLVARQHVALMSHDLPSHTLHPAAASHIIFEPQDCCPCYYTTRSVGTVCQAGRAACGVFAMERYCDTAVATLRNALTAA